FGRHYGIMLQLSTDLHDAQDVDAKSDLRTLKATLPILFYMRQRGSLDVGGPQPVDIQESGALHFTWTIVEIQRDRCREIVHELALLGQSTITLQTFLTPRNSQRLRDEDEK